MLRESNMLEYHPKKTFFFFGQIRKGIDQCGRIPISRIFESCIEIQEFPLQVLHKESKISILEYPFQKT